LDDTIQALLIQNAECYVFSRLNLSLFKPNPADGIVNTMTSAMINLLIIIALANRAL
jgi:hypothetical protein